LFESGEASGGCHSIMMYCTSVTSFLLHAAGRYYPRRRLSRHAINGSNVESEDGVKDGVKYGVD